MDATIGKHNLKQFGDDERRGSAPAGTCQQDTDTFSCGSATRAPGESSSPTASLVRHVARARGRSAKPAPGPMTQVRGRDALGFVVLCNAPLLEGGTGVGLLCHHSSAGCRRGGEYEATAY